MSGFGGIYCQHCCRSCEAKVLPSSREEQQTHKNCFCLTVRGHSKTFPDSQEEALGQAGKTHSQIAGWPKRSEGHRGLSDCPPAKSGCYLGMTFLGQLCCCHSWGLTPQLSAGKLGGFKASHESLMKFKGKFKEANYRLLTKAQESTVVQIAGENALGGKSVYVCPVLVLFQMH